MPRNLIFFVLFLVVVATYSQEIPRHQQLLGTFGNMSGADCADDDFLQVVFFALPASHSGELCIRVYDPDCGGLLDRPNGLWETNTTFTVYGGRGCITEKDARGVAPTGNYASGTLLQRAIFADESEVDGKWVTLGPFNASDGEQVDAYPGYVFFKLLVEGQTGDDGNVYGLFLSQQPGDNKPIPHAVFFSYERVVVEGDDIRTIQADAGLMPTDEIKLPLQLDELRETPSYNVIAEPIGE